MERRNFLKLAFGAAAGAAVFAASVQAAPLSPRSIEGSDHLPRGNADARPAVTSGEEAAELQAEQVHWNGRGGWHHRHWGWHHRHWGWRHRHWGWRHRHHHWRHW